VDGGDNPSALPAAWPSRHEPAYPASARQGGRRLAAATAVAKGDPDRDEALASLRQQLVELPEGAVVLAEDETHVNLLPWVRATWILTGQRTKVMTPGKNRRRTILAPSTWPAPLLLPGGP
jgi:hypothetical protein